MTLNNYKENNTKIIQKSQRRTLIRNETLKNQVIHHKKVNVGKSALKIKMGHRRGWNDEFSKSENQYKSKLVDKRLQNKI